MELANPQIQAEFIKYIRLQTRSFLLNFVVIWLMVSTVVITISVFSKGDNKNILQQIGATGFIQALLGSIIVALSFKKLILIEFVGPSLLVLAVMMMMLFWKGFLVEDEAIGFSGKHVTSSTFYFFMTNMFVILFTTCSYVPHMLFR